MDSLLVMCLMGTTVFFASAVAAVIVIIAVSPWVVIAMPFIGAIYL